MNNIKVIFRASTVDEEFERVWHFLNEYSWFNRHHYRAILPAHPEVDNMLKISLKNRGLTNKYKTLTKKIIEETYDKKDYQKGLWKLKKSGIKVRRLFPIFNRYHKLWGFRVHKNYEVIVTIYGTRGSYNKNTGSIQLYFNKNGKRKRIFEDIAHEMVHIGIEDIIRKFKIIQDEKERIVDLFCSKELKIRGYDIQKRGDRNVDEFIISNKFNLPLALNSYVKKYPRKSGFS